MKYGLLVLACIVAIPGACLGQDAHGIQIFGGYSRVGRQAPAYNGWNASVAINLYKGLDVVADFAGSYNSQQFISSPFSSNSSSARYAFLFGPRLSYRGYERLTPFIHLMAGLERDTANGSYSFGSSIYNYDYAQNLLCVAVGTGLDIKVTRRIAVRAIQFDGLGLEAAGAWGADYRFSTGLVLRFGGKK